MRTEKKHPAIRPTRMLRDPNCRCLSFCGQIRTNSSGNGSVWDTTASLFSATAIRSPTTASACKSKCGNPIDRRICRELTSARNSPISNGGKIEFAKPGIDSNQQGYVYAEGDVPNESDRHRLPYSPISIELKPGKLRVKEDSRANYADILEIDHDSQVMVVGDVARYFDRVRRNVNKATMRKTLVKALEAYRAKKDGDAAAVAATSGDDMDAPPPPTPPIDENRHGSRGPDFSKPNYKPNESQLSLDLRGGARLHRSRSPTASIRSRASRAGLDRRSSHDPDRRHQKKREKQREREGGHDRSSSRDTVRDEEAGTSYRNADQETYRLSYAEQERRKEFSRPPLPRSSSSRHSKYANTDSNAVPSSIAVLRQGVQKNSNYDIRSMHDVALAGYQHEQND